MTKIHLEQMTNIAFEKFKQRTINSYARDLTDNSGLAYEEAFDKSKKQTEHLLKDGLNTKNHDFLSIVENDLNIIIGHIWFEHDVEPEEIFVYHIEVLEEYRNRGYGKSAFSLFEVYLKRKCISRVRLNVFEKNVIARSMYEKQGFQITNVQMQKNL
ncbi:GNAT family N-acetyltransferase [bacterium]|nr:GNAT family N-acetyltransferase [bacterium]